MNGAMYAVVLLLLAVPLTMYHGWVTYLLWGWFAVPLGAPPIGIAWAIGLAAMVGMFTSRPASSEDGQELSGLVHAVFYPALALAVGYVAKQFM